METRTLQLVLQYDGGRFAGWQRQPDERTVQGVLEEAMQRLCGTRVAVLGAGRTDAGVHALGQAAGVQVSSRWTAPALMRALNAVLPWDVRVAGASEMRADFHARYSALSRSYTYLVGTDADAASPFRSTRELVWRKPLDRRLLDAAASLVTGEHIFRAFAVKGTAPASDDHRCVVTSASWRDREGGLAFCITANRFLHHMVRFLVGTMLEIAAGRRDLHDLTKLLTSALIETICAPAPTHSVNCVLVDGDATMTSHSQSLDSSRERISVTASELVWP